MGGNTRSAGRRRSRWTALAAATGLVALAVVPVGAPIATAADTEADSGESVVDGTWYFDRFDIGALHEQGITGAGMTVAVLDTPINPDVPDLVGTNLEPRTEHMCENGYDGVSEDEDAEHGTSMVSVIIGNDRGVDGLVGIPGVAPDATVLHYAVLSDPAETGCDITLTDSVEDAIENGARIISMSLGWNDTEDIARAVLAAHRAGVVVNIAVQNEDGDELDTTSGANGVVAIENMMSGGGSDGREVHSNSLTGVAPGVNIRGPAYGDGEWNSYHLGVGSSPATAWTSGIVALAWSKWPEATGNQMIQSLIRNTSNPWPVLARTNLEGFGLFSPQNMVLWDPTEYPDENPLLVDRPDAYPSWEDVMGPDAVPTDWEFTNAGEGFGTSIPSAVPTKIPPPFWETAEGVRTMLGIVALVLWGVLLALLVVRIRSGRPIAWLERLGTPRRPRGGPPQLSAVPGPMMPGPMMPSPMMPSPAMPSPMMPSPAMPGPMPGPTATEPAPPAGAPVLPTGLPTALPSAVPAGAPESTTGPGTHRS